VDASAGSPLPIPNVMTWQFYLATFAGIWLVRRVSGRLFYRIIYVFTFLIGLKLIFDGARRLIGS
jgi:uncharacterized membrane protein YfcA